jgi:hypothetical protein
MADISITAANVVAGTGAKTMPGTAGGTITAGMSVYRHTDGKFLPAEHDDTAVKAAAVGIALNSASVNQPLVVQTDGPVAMGTVFTIGQIIVVGAAGGAIAPSADPGVADFVTIMGVATSTSVLQLKINASGVAIPGA